MVGLRLEPSGLPLDCVFLHCSTGKGLPGLNQEESLEAGWGGWGGYKAGGALGRPEVWPGSPAEDFAGGRGISRLPPGKEDLSPSVCSAVPSPLRTPVLPPWPGQRLWM